MGRAKQFPLAVVSMMALGTSSCLILDENVDEISGDAPEGDVGEVLKLVNQVRQEGRNCGKEGTFGRTSPLGWNDKLARAAQRHADDMASHNFMGHTGSDGSTMADRITDEGYAWSALGENVAAGQKTPNEVVSSWLSSPGHCANIMNPAFEHMGAARAQGGSYGVVWAQTFGTSR